MKISFLEDGWQDYLYWQNQDKKTLKRINQIIKDIQRNPLLISTFFILSEGAIALNLSIYCKGIYGKKIYNLES